VRKARQDKGIADNTDTLFPGFSVYMQTLMAAIKVVAALFFKQKTKNTFVPTEGLLQS
jgi:hypothetical protein